VTLQEGFAGAGFEVALKSDGCVFVREGEVRSQRPGQKFRSVFRTAFIVIFQALPKAACQPM